MNPAEQTITDTSGGGGEAQVTITVEATQWVAQEPERVIEQLRIRATQIGPILESILRERREEGGSRRNE